jgi:hypothetical protein
MSKERFQLYLDQLFDEAWDWLVVGKIDFLEVR